MEENTSKVFAVADSAMAAASVMSATGAGTSLFVINLCASMAPVPNVAKSLPGLESYRLYQVARREDGRTRYRLRLGFFTSEEDAESVLAVVRDSYPTAFTACLCDEDKKFTRGYVAEASPPKATPKIAVVVENKKPSPAPAPSIAKPAAPAKAAAKSAPPPAKSVASAAPAASAAKPAPDSNATVIQQGARAAAPVQPAPSKKTPPAAQPESPVEIELSWDPPALQPAAPASTAVPQVVAPAFKTQDVIKAPAAAPTKSAAEKLEAAKAASKPQRAAAPTPNKATIEAPSKLLQTIELTLEKEPVPKAEPKAQAAKPASNEPFRVGRGVDIPATSLTLESTQTLAAAKTTSASSAPAKKTSSSASPAAPAQRAAELPKPATPIAVKTHGKLPDLDSTQTIRALTSDELESESQEKWFAIQLAVSEQPVNLDAMPRLDIFEAYRLYSVASAGSGKITHSLRIGFFREQVSAEAVAGYLKTFFAAPTVVRISIAEHARFKDPPSAKPEAKASEAKVLDLSHARERAAKPIPTVTMEVATPHFDPSATGSFKASATGTHKALATGAHKALSASGAHRALDATGTHKGLKAASKAAPPATKRSAPLSKTSATGKHKSLQPKKSLAEQLLEEARQVQLSESGIRKLPKNESLLSKMFGKRK